MSERGRFGSLSGSFASRKRKRRFSATRRPQREEEELTGIVKDLNKKLCKSLHGTGVNSGSTPSGVQEVYRLLNKGKRLTRDSVFVDFGCSVGGVCLYVAWRAGCKVIGIEKDENALQFGRDFLANHPALARKCQFIAGDFAKVVDESFLMKHGVTHVFAYDAVFSPDTWHMLFERLAAGPPIVGVSCARKRECPLPPGFTVLEKSAKPIGLTGSPSKFKVVSWKNDVCAEVCPHRSSKRNCQTSQVHIEQQSPHPARTLDARRQSSRAA